VHLRRAAAGVATVLVGLGLVVLDPNGPEAMAYTGFPVPPVVVPSSTLTGGSLDMATAAERARAVGNVIPQSVSSGGGLRIPATAAKVATKGGGQVMVAATGFFIGFEGTNWVMNAMGVDNVGLGALFPDTTAVGYIPNPDAVGGVPGWDGGINYVTGIGREGNNWQDQKYLMADVTFDYEVGPIADNGSGALVQYMNCKASTSLMPSNETTQTVYIKAYRADGSIIGDGKSFTQQATSTDGFCTMGFQSWLPGWSQNIPLDITRYEFWAPQQWGQSFEEVTGSVPQAIYRLPNDPERFEGGESDPLRAWETRWQCSDSGSTVATIRSATFREGDGSIPAYPSPVCVGEVTHVEIWEVGVNGDVDDVKVWEADPSVNAQTFGKEYPQCTDGSCRLELYRKDPTAGTQISCLENPSLCVNWLSDPARVENYQCVYAGQPVDLSECNVYGPTFNVQTGTDVDTDTGKKPSTDVGVYGDPATGKPVPATPTDVVPNPGTNPGGQPGGSPEPDGSCPPPFTWSSLFNPWWYYKGTVCALSDAFVPTQTQAKVAAIATKIQTKTPVPELTSISDALAPPAGGTECLRLSLPISFVIGHDQPMLDSCTWSDPVSKLLRDYRPLFTVVVWVLTIAPMAWWAWRTYAPGSTGTA
jgi:hypothetical protein